MNKEEEKKEISSVKIQDEKYNFKDKYLRELIEKIFRKEEKNQN